MDSVSMIIDVRNLYKIQECLKHCGAPLKENTLRSYLYILPFNFSAKLHTTEIRIIQKKRWSKAFGPRGPLWQNHQTAIILPK